MNLVNGTAEGDGALLTHSGARWYAAPAAYQRAPECVSRAPSPSAVPLTRFTPATRAAK
ncbi:hypothetical protein MAHJHV28_45890 [Mycobacterium avium subsp. hominissuis]